MYFKAQTTTNHWFIVVCVLFKLLVELKKRAEICGKEFNRNGQQDNSEEFPEDINTAFADQFLDSGCGTYHEIHKYQIEYKCHNNVFDGIFSA